MAKDSRRKRSSSSSSSTHCPQTVKRTRAEAVRTLRQNLRKRRSSSSSAAKKRSGSAKKHSGSAKKRRNTSSSRPRKGGNLSHKGRSLSDRRRSSSKETTAKKGTRVLKKTSAKEATTVKKKKDSSDEEKIKKKKDGSDANRQKKGDILDVKKEKDGSEANKIKKKKDVPDSSKEKRKVAADETVSKLAPDASKEKSASKERSVPKESGKKAKTAAQLAIEARFAVVEDDVGKTGDAASAKADLRKPANVLDTDATQNDAEVVPMATQDDNQDGKIMNLAAEIAALRGSMIENELEVVEDGWMLDLRTEIDLLRGVIKENEMELVEEPAENSADAEHPNAKLRRANTALQETLEEKLGQLNEAKAKPLGYIAEEDPEKMRGELVSVREMLDERVQRQMAMNVSHGILETQEGNDLEVEIEILRGILRETELEFCCMGVTFVRSDKQEMALVKETAITAQDHVEQLPVEYTKQKEPEKGIDLTQSAEVIQAQIQEKLEKARMEAEAVLSCGPQRLEATAAAPPVELPEWCVTPRRQDIVTEVEMVRVSSVTDNVLNRIWFGQRSWALVGRRPAHAPTSGATLDISLAALRASRSHALLLRNRLGQVFLMDLGSPNGTFMDSKRLKPKEATEWKVGSTVYFGDSKPEVFELHVWKAVLPSSEGQVGTWQTIPKVSE